MKPLLTLLKTDPFQVDSLSIEQDCGALRQWEVVR
jgi:hypothetical protein